MKKMGLRAIIFITVSILSFGLLAETGEYSDLIGTLKTVEKEGKTTGLIKADCLNCENPKNLKDSELSFELNNKEIDLEKLRIYKDNTPYIIHLKRTKNSPLEVVLKIKNGYVKCEKMAITSLAPAALDCVYSTTVLVDHKIDLNLKKLPPPSENEEQIIELIFSKPDAEARFYSLDARVQDNASSKAKITKKVLGRGYKIELSDSTKVHP
jgi:hypothetical protein